MALVLFCFLLHMGKKTSEVRRLIVSKQTDKGENCLPGGFIFSLGSSSEVVLKGMILLFKLILGI